MVVPAAARLMRRAGCGPMEISRRMHSRNHESIMLSAIALAIVVGKIISPAAAIPVGIVTAIAGIPMLFAVIIHKGSRP